MYGNVCCCAAFIELASRLPPERAIEALIRAGLIYASSDAPEAVSCPEVLKIEFEQVRSEGAKKLAPLLTLAKDLDSYKWGVAGLAGFLGHNNFARFLEGLDYFEGRFYHLSIYGPFPLEE